MWSVKLQKENLNAALTRPYTGLFKHTKQALLSNRRAYAALTPLVNSTQPCPAACSVRFKYSSINPLIYLFIIKYVFIDDFPTVTFFFFFYNFSCNIFQSIHLNLNNFNDINFGFILESTFLFGLMSLQPEPELDIFTKDFVSLLQVLVHLIIKSIYSLGRISHNNFTSVGSI